MRLAVASWIGLGCLVAIGCHRKKPGGELGDAAAAAPPPPATAAMPALERFVALRARGDGDLDLAAVARDRTVLLARLDPALHARTVQTLAPRFEATEETALTLLAGGAVVVSGRVADRLGTFLLDASAGETAREIGADWCETARGVAWIARETGGARVLYHRAALDGGAPIDARSAPVTVSAEREAHLSCGPDAVVVSLRDGEDLSLVRLRPLSPELSATSSASPAPVEVEREGERDDELRDRFVDVRAGDETTLVRVGTDSVAVRTWGATLGAWSEVHVRKESGGPGRRFVLSEDADVIDVAASPRAGGTVFLLASEPMAGSCKDGDPPRRIVLHALTPAASAGSEGGGAGSGGGALETRRPVLELACGVEAIAAHLAVDPTADVARLWWSEPVADGSCAFPGLGVGAVVQASSDQPGARRRPILAEGVAAVGDGRFAGVVRNGGCAPYDALGNGTLEWAE